MGSGSDRWDDRSHGKNGAPPGRPSSSSAVSMVYGVPTKSILVLSCTRFLPMRFKQPLTIFLLAVLVVLAGCSRDPNVAKKRYLDSGNKYFDKGQLKQAR